MPHAERETARRTTAHGQTLVEFSLALPVFLLLLLVSIQVAIVIVQQYSLMRVTRETTRWLAIHPDTVDADVATHARGNSLSLDQTRFTSVSVSPPCPTLTGGRCGNHGSGTLVSVSVQYDITNQLFLPTTFRLAWLQVNIPTALPPYRVSATVE